MPSPAPGASSTTVVSASDTTSTSDCPTPTVSTSTTSQPAASSTRRAWGVAHARPPRWPRVAIERMNTPSSVACSPIRTRSPSSAPPEKGEVGSTARTPTRRPCSRNARTSTDVDVDLPTPGGPVRPTTWARPPYGASAAATSRSCPPPDVPTPSSTREISRATARCSPRRARSTRSVTAARRAMPVGSARRRHADDQSIALATAAAQRSDAGATTAALELEREVQREAGARHADRVAERDGTAVDVDLLRVDAELLRGHHADRGERLVDLHQVEVGGGDALLGACSGDRVGRLLVQARVRPGDHAVGTDLRDPGEPALLGLGLAHDHHGGGTVRDGRRRARGDRAVRGEGGPQLGQALGCGVGADALV